MMIRDRVVALIPERAGSERVAGKNVRPLGGRPLLEWTIDAARRATTIDRVVVSTDSAEIAAIAREAGAEKGSPTGDVIVPFPMDEIESIDINTPLDFDHVELVAQRMVAVPSG
jgi:CMP-N-acetylneuraminic acid synthetase